MGASLPRAGSVGIYSSFQILPGVFEALSLDLTP